MCDEVGGEMQARNFYPIYLYFNPKLPVRIVVNLSWSGTKKQTQSHDLIRFKVLFFVETNQKTDGCSLKSCFEEAFRRPEEDEESLTQTFDVSIIFARRNEFRALWVGNRSE